MINKIMNSKRFQKLLEYILAVGNYMNSINIILLDGSARGNKYGFKLSTLDKLYTTKTSDNKLTLLQYIINFVYDKDREILYLEKDWKDLDKIYNMQLDVINTEINQLRSICNQVKSILYSPKIDDTDNYGVIAELYYKDFNELLNECMNDYNNTINNLHEMNKYFDENINTKSEEILGKLNELLEKIMEYRKELDKKMGEFSNKGIINRHKSPIKNIKKKVYTDNTIAGGVDMKKLMPQNNNVFNNYKSLRKCDSRSVFIYIYLDNG